MIEHDKYWSYGTVTVNGQTAYRKGEYFRKEVSSANSSAPVWQSLTVAATGSVMSFLRGSDLSGSIQGAGGVGGVLAVNFGLSPFNPQPSTHCASYDGNGNVAALHSAADGSESAVFEYGPFSEPIRVTGPVASLMPLRFSTMYEDNVTGDRKYLFRDLTPSTGRWKSRDFVEGPNLYMVIINSPITSIDYLGLSALDTVTKKLKEERDLFLGVPSVEKTGFARIVRLFYAMRFMIHARYGELPGGTAARWMRDENEMVLDGDLVSPATIVHEMTHAYNDLILGLGDYWSFRKDEGMGSAMQSFETLARTLLNGEVDLKGHPCNYERTKQFWQTLWKDYGIVPSIAWGEGAAWSRFKVNAYDLENIKNTFGVRLSCQDTADVFNSIIGSTDCCLRVKCSGPDTGYEIGPGAVIVPIFQ